MKNTRIVRVVLVAALVCALVFCFAEGMRIHEEQGGIHPIETVTSEFARVVNGVNADGTPSNTSAPVADSNADNQSAMEEDAVGALAEGEVA